MDISAVKKSYKYWAPIYDRSFGAFTRSGRRRAVDYINSRTGKVLEIGVGTGLSLAHYKPHLDITGIDVSPEMLAKAQEKVDEGKLSHVTCLREMDARHLDFPDNTFDTIVAMYLVSVVPDPEQVVAEMSRVCKPGGKILIVNHFAREDGFLAFVERMFAPFANLLGWHSDFPMDRVLGSEPLVVEEIRPCPPFRMFTFLLQQKQA